MTAITSTTSAVKPGHLTDAIAIGSRASKLLERHGARQCRLLSALTAGEVTGTLVLTTEYDDMEAYGAASDAMVADAELLDLMDSVRAADSPITITTQSVQVEIPLDRAGNTAEGSYVEVHLSRLTPGRMEDALASSTRCADFVEAHGASNTRLSTFVLAGQMANTLVVSWEFPTMKAFGALSEAWNVEPEGLALYTEFLGSAPSTTEIFAGLYATIPL